MRLIIKDGTATLKWGLILWVGLFLNIENSTQFRISLHNSLGTEIREIFQGNLEVGSHNIDFSTKNLLSGVYFLYIFNELDSSSKFIKLIK